MTDAGVNAYVGTFDTSTSGSGMYCTIDVLSVGSTIGMITGTSLASGGSGYDVGTGYQLYPYYYSNGTGATVDITSIINGAAKTVSKVNPGSGYLQGGQNYENQVTGIGGNDLYIIIGGLYNETAGGHSIAIGDYSGT